MKICTNNKTMNVARYAYDALGRRIYKYDPALATPEAYYYYNDQWQILAEYTSATSCRHWCTYGNYVDEVLSRSTHPTLSLALQYYTHDHLYSPAALTNYNAYTVWERYEYDAYGKVTIWNAGFTATRMASDYGNPFTFTGRELDILDGGALHHMHYRHRDYSPALGRFLQQDPLGYVDGLNLYEYTSSKPLIGLDPQGTEVTGTKAADYWIDSNMPRRRVTCKKDGCCIRWYGRKETCEFPKKSYLLIKEKYEWAPDGRWFWQAKCKKTHTRLKFDRERFGGPVVGFADTGFFKPKCNYTIEVATYSNPFAGKIVPGSFYQLHIYQEDEEVVWIPFTKEICEKYVNN